MGAIHRCAVLMLAWASIASGQSAQAADLPRAPNIVFILADDLGYADVSAYKSDRFPTPNIDRVGNEGARFTDGYSTAPVC